MDNRMDRIGKQISIWGLKHFKAKNATVSELERSSLAHEFKGTAELVVLLDEVPPRRERHTVYWRLDQNEDAVCSLEAI